MPAIKLVARLAMVMAISFVAHTVSSEAIASSEADKVMSVSALAPSPVVVGGQKDMMRSLRAEGAAIVRPEEERMQPLEAGAEGVAQAAKKLAGSKWAAETNAVSERLKMFKLNDAADDIESGGLSHTKMMKSADDIDGQRPSHIKTNPRAGFDHFDWNGPITNFLAKAVPRTPPEVIYDAEKNPVFLTHKVKLLGGKTSFLVKIPVTRPLLNNLPEDMNRLVPSQRSDDYAFNWLMSGVLPNDVDELLTAHSLQHVKAKVTKEFNMLFKARDIGMRSDFPEYLDKKVRGLLQQREKLMTEEATTSEIVQNKEKEIEEINKAIQVHFMKEHSNKHHAHGAAALFYSKQFLYFCDFFESAENELPQSAILIVEFAARACLALIMHDPKGVCLV